MTDDDAWGEEGKNEDFWMTSFVNNPLLVSISAVSQSLSNCTQSISDIT